MSQKMNTNTKEQILETAEKLTKSLGFDGFSFRDISKEVGVKTSSIHYHFATKESLSESLIERYAAGFVAMLEKIDSENISGYSKIKQLFTALLSASGDERNLCLCGMLSANVNAIPQKAKELLDTFFHRMERWVEKVIEEGIEDGSIHKSVRARSAAAEIVALMEGAMLLARVRKNPSYFIDLTDLQLTKLRA